MVDSLGVPSTIAGRYAIERELGRGATATVYLARDSVLGRPVAIKVLRRELAESIGAERFLREIRLTAQLQHPNIVPVLDSGDAGGGILYFVLPYMDGGTLRERIARETQLSINAAVDIARTIAMALEYAHGRGLIHRDVKPENILFTSGQACLADFGIARVLDQLSADAVTTTGLVRGTPAYMSPEQAGGGRDYDGRTDVYSLGCVLYEMVTGMMPYVGPTPESIIAQRFNYAPRPVRAYRASAPEELEVAIDRALMAVPADRYPSAQAFAEALASIEMRVSTGAVKPVNLPVTATSTTNTAWRALARPRGIALAFVIAALAIAALLGGGRLIGRLRVAEAAVDTTRIAVLPFEHVGGNGRATPSEMLLIEAMMSRWHGISVVEPFQVSDAIARLGRAVASTQDAREIALTLGAGRFIRGSSTGVGDSMHVHVAIYDVRSSDALHSYTLRLPQGLAGADSMYGRVADTLLLRGSSSAPGTRTPLARGTRSLPAVQSFARALSALEDWDLVAADSALSLAMRYDRDYARAQAWLAQVRAWQQLRSWEPEAPAPWAALADKALDNGAQLSNREREFTQALAFLGHGSFAKACDAYDEMRRKQDHDFTAWYGLAQCRTLDDAVIADARSPSHWRYRSSYHQGVQAFVRAVEMLPSVHRGFERRAFDALTSVLYIRGVRYRPGYALGDDSLRFGSFAGWDGDTLVFIPAPMTTAGVASAFASRSQRERALREQRSLFHLIATSWATALPRSAGAKHALAVSLDLLGDPAGADTIASARRLTNDPAYRLQLAASEEMLRFKYGVAGRGPLERARELADSLLRANPTPDRAAAELLASSAALVGDCRRALALTVAGATAETSPVFVPAHIMAAANARLMTTALGCGPMPGVPTLEQLVERIQAAPELAQHRDLMEASLTTQAAVLLFPSDSAWIRHVTKQRAPLRTFVAQAALLRGDTASARTTLAQIRAARAQSVVDVASPEFALAEARLSFAVRDFAGAAASLDSARAAAPLLSTSVLVTDDAQLGSVINGLVLRADVADAMGDRAMARRMATAVLAVWRGAGAELSPVVTRMQRYIR